MPVGGPEIFFWLPVEWNDNGVIAGVFIKKIPHAPIGFVMRVEVPKVWVVWVSGVNLESPLTFPHWTL